MAACFAGQSAAMICSTSPNTAIPDGSGSATPGATASVFITVPPAYTNNITDLNFLAQINHTYVGDLIVRLISPLGTTVTLIDRPGRPPATYGCSGNNINATLDDGAATAIENQCAGAVPTITGTHSPNGSLSAFNGQAPAGVWRIDVTDNAGQDTGTIISSGMCLDLTTVPVVLSQFTSQQRGKYLVARWQTATEAFNLGFDLWGQINSDWVQLNPALIASRQFDSTSPQNYRHKFDLTQFDGEITAVGISSVSSAGEEEFFGPFDIGEQYGEETIPAVVDWTGQRQTFARSMRNAGFSLLNGKWRQNKGKSRRNRQTHFEPFLVSTQGEGVYQISHQELLDAGLDLTGVPRRKIAVTRNNVGVPRSITRSKNSKKFGPGSSIIFYAKPVDPENARYVDQAVYKISLDPDNAIPIKKTRAPKRRDLANASAQMTTTLLVGEPKLYSFILPGNQPWYDSPIQAYRQTGRKLINFSIPETVLTAQAAQLKLNLLGGIDFPGIDVDGDGEPEPHHHYKIYVNRNLHPEPVHEGFADGFNPINIEIDVVDQFTPGENTVEFELIPDNGLNLDAAYFIDASVSFQQPSTMLDDSLVLRAQPGHELQQVTIPSGSRPQAFGFDTSGNFSQLGVRRIANDAILVNVPPKIQQGVTPGIWIAATNGFKHVSAINLAVTPTAKSMALDEIDYVVIAHPSLIGPDLDRFVAAQSVMGRRTKIVSSQDIFDLYSDGQPLPIAIQKYLQTQALESPFQYVLLVGNHTYNYRGFNHNNAANDAPLNLIPSFYREGKNLSRQIPTAVPFVDFDFDGAPDRAIGRWPVKDQTQLKHIVDKTLAWHAEGSLKDSLSVLSIAEQAEALNHFTPSSERLLQSLGTVSQPWTSIERIHMDDYVGDPAYDQSTLLGTTRQRIADSINDGHALTIFNGHGSPNTWGKQSLMNAAVADLLTNTQKPSIMMPLACYTTYYETPYTKSLAELLLVDNAAGAVALLAPALLSKPIDNENFARQVLHNMTVKGKSIGEATLEAKRTTHAQGLGHQATVYNWVLLSDPSLSFNTPDITEPAPIEIPKSLER
ncbi:hypothetical protein GCM10008090_22250 [Arenicella chitinivorans]|uniref:P/Homo B domain-containing protein n=2 Tax=Arenicella chitinivorans TaxID=1329800 RepID=A0A918RVX2_9GAMM|nr:hypothetical protein GCM10008090_22250 [Arenicella chitinivorans]